MEQWINTYRLMKARKAYDIDLAEFENKSWLYRHTHKAPMCPTEKSVEEFLE